MEVYAELTKVRGEIEQIKGRMQILSQLSSLSTIRLDLIPDALASPIVAPGWRPLTVVRAATRTLITTLKWIAEVLIWVVIYVLPLTLLIGLVVAGVGRLRKRFQSSPPPPPSAE